MSDWGIEDLDLDAYLRRIGVHKPTLKSVHAGHVASIPFENIEVLLGGVPALDLPSLQAKLVDRKRGGYCFEHNLLYTAALERLGITVRRLLARPRLTRESAPAKTHMMATAEVDGELWLTDVGWGGGGLLEPMPLREGTMSQGDWTFRLTRLGEHWILQSLIAGSWTDLYGFTTEPAYPSDYAMANFYTARLPTSPFALRLIVQTTTAEYRRALSGDELATTRPSGETEKRTLTSEEILAALVTSGIELTDAERDGLQAKI